MGGGHGSYDALILVFDFNAKLIQKLLRHDVDPEPLCVGNGVNQRGVLPNDPPLDFVLDLDMKIVPIHFATSTSSALGCTQALRWRGGCYGGNQILRGTHRSERPIIWVGMVKDA
jgi:hypothetical protein